MENNLRVVGGITAEPHSWPSIVMITASYKTIVYLGGDEVLVSKSYICGGSLIDRRTVLTAAHCILEQLDYYYINKTYTINVTANEYFPTNGSLYKVYVGAHRFVEPDYDIKPARVVSVEKPIRVSIKTLET